jgi:hypothetical protein
VRVAAPADGEGTYVGRRTRSGSVLVIDASDVTQRNRSFNSTVVRDET